MFFRHLHVVLWKNYLLRKRNHLKTLLEVLVPLIFISVLGLIRQFDLVDHHPDCYHQPKPLLSNGFLNVFRSIFCDGKNSCFRSEKHFAIGSRWWEPNRNLNHSLLDDMSSVDMTIVALSQFLQDYPDAPSLQSVIGSLRPSDVMDIDKWRGSLSMRGLNLTNAEFEKVSKDQLLAWNNTLIPQINPIVFVLVNFLHQYQLLPERWLPYKNMMDVYCMIRGIRLCNLDRKYNRVMISESVKHLNNSALIADVITHYFNGINGTSVVQRDLVLSLHQRIVAIFHRFSSNHSSNGSEESLINLVSAQLCGRQYADSFMGPGTAFSKRFSKDNLKKLLSIFLETRNQTKTVSSNDSCVRLVTHLKKSFISRMLPIDTIILGKLVYYPSTNATEAILRPLRNSFRQWNRFSEVFDGVENQTSMRDLYQDVIKKICLTDLPNEFQGILLRICAKVNNSKEKEKETEETDENVMMIDLLLSLAKCGGELQRFVLADNITHLEWLSRDLADRENLWASIVFNNITSDDSTHHLTYSIRMDIDHVNYRLHGLYRDPIYMVRPEFNLHLYRYGFLHLQELVSRGYIEYVSGLGLSNLGTFIQPTPYPCYSEDNFSALILRRQFPFVINMGWVFTVCLTVKSIVYEKEKRLKEVMKIMGLSDMVHWVAWLITSLIIIAVSLAGQMIIIITTGILNFSDMLLIVIILSTYAFAITSEAFLMSVFFTNANIAAMCSVAVYFMLGIPDVYIVINENTITEGQYFALSILPQVALKCLMRYIAAYEDLSQGLQWSNVYESPAMNDSFSPMKAYTMLILDIILLWILIWYFERVFPSKYGIHQPWYFPFTRDYWCSNRYNDDVAVAKLKRHDDDNEGLLNQREKGFEPPHEDYFTGIAIRNLSKSYSNSGNRALDDLTVNFYEGHISSLLGHNGAGKTTALSILTGLLQPSTGTAYMHGIDICRNIVAARAIMGFCPQHNVLFSNLTVAEHMYFYGQLKGLSKTTITNEMTEHLSKVGLPYSANVLCRNLSGGMKRKLSVALAFLGNSSIVILDEPTTGVDPQSRRAIWNLLLQCKTGRTIILTTHYMDEADVLGDRIMLLSQGRLVCAGSGLFLKKKFGTGYKLTFALDKPSSPPSATTVGKVTSAATVIEGASAATVVEGASAAAAAATAESQKCSLRDELLNIVCARITTASLLTESTHEMTVLLPLHTTEDSLCELFCHLEQHYNDLHFGISDSTLEEIFIMLVSDPSAVDCRREISPVNSGKALMNNNQLPDDAQLIDRHLQQQQQWRQRPVLMNKGYRLYWRQMMTLIWKRAITVLRSKRSWMIELVIPVLVVNCFAAILQLLPVAEKPPPVVVHPWLMAPRRGNTRLNTYFKSHDSPDSWMYEFCRHTMGLSGERCLRFNYSNRAVISRSNGADDADDADDSTTNSGNIVEEGLFDGIPQFPCNRMYAQNEWNHPLDGSALNFSMAPCTDPFMGRGERKRLLQPPWKLMPSNDNMFDLSHLNVSEWITATFDQFRSKRYGGLEFLMNRAFQPPVPFLNASLFQHYEVKGNSDNNNDDDDNESMTRNYTIFAQIFEIFANWLNDENVERSSIVWFDSKGHISASAYLNVFHNYVLRYVLQQVPSGNRSLAAGITVISHPLPFSNQRISINQILRISSDFMLSLSIILATACIASSFTMHLVTERVSHVKHLQLVAGVSPYLYWLSNYLWDILNYCVPIGLIIATMFIFGRDTYTSPDTIGPLIAILMLYGCAIIPASYTFSFLFNVPSLTFSILFIINYSVGLVTTLVTTILDQLQQEDENLKTLNDLLKQIFLFLPQYCMGRSMMDIPSWQFRKDFLSDIEPLLHWNQIGRYAVVLAVEAPLFFLLVLMLETKCFGMVNALRFHIEGHRLLQRSSNNVDLDVDVLRERERVIIELFRKEAMSGDSSKTVTDSIYLDATYSTTKSVNAYCQRQQAMSLSLLSSSPDVLLVHNLSKIFIDRHGIPCQPPDIKRAVNDLTFGVHRGECFGLLGTNGAGKSTTFAMLTKQLTPTSGRAYLNGVDVFRASEGTRALFGYCPQFNALLDGLTGYETLEFFSYLLGIPTTNIPAIVDDLINRLGLQPYAGVLSKFYSGGNQRKLCTAIALLGAPAIIFLDEPTSGMDPGAQRFLWTLLKDVVASGQSIILTSHSMAECEALCDRLVVMVDGTFRCLGSPQHLKSTFGNCNYVTLKIKQQQRSHSREERREMEGGVDVDGTIIDVTANTNDNNLHTQMDNVRNTTMLAFPDCTVLVETLNYLQLEFKRSIPLSMLFRHFGKLKASTLIEDFSIMQATLEHVFLKLASLSAE